MIVIGIDPGKDGAGVRLETDGSALVVSVVRWRDVLGKRDWTEAGPQVADAVAELARGATLVALERDAGRPGEGATSARTIGRGWGLLYGVLLAHGHEVRVPTAASWQRDVFAGCPGEGKDRAIWLAASAGVELRRGRERTDHDGIADAYCLARWALRQVRA